MFHKTLILFALGFMFGLSCNQAGAEVMSDPHGFAVRIDVDEEVEQIITLSNNSDDPVTFEIGIDVIDLEDEDNFNQGPRRDQPEGRFAIFEDRNAWGWISEVVFDRIGDIDYELFNSANDLGDADLDEFDALWVVGTDQTDQFVQQWAENLERFEDYIDHGRAMFIEEGWNQTHLAELPGGLRDDRRPQEGILTVGPEDNWMIEQCGFREGQRFNCGNTTHVVYPEERIEDIDNSDWYQIIMVGDETDQPCEFIYQYGRGYVVVSGQPSGHVWRNHWDRGSMWGNRAEPLLYWLIMLGSPKWILTDPDEGEIGANDELEITVHLNSEDMEESVNYAILEIESIDPEQLLLQIPVLMTIGLATANLSGVITDEATGDPISGAMMATTPFDVRRFSDEEGAWSVSDLPLGDYTLAFSARDFLPTTANIEFGEGGDYEQDISLLHSECNLSVEGIIADLAPDTDTEVDFSISNDGNGLLTYTSDRRLLGDANAEPWEWRNSFGVGQAVEDDDIYGVVFIGDQFYVSGENDGEPVIYIFSREGELVEAIPQVVEGEDGIRDLAWDGELMWGTESDDIFGFTPEGELISTLRGPFRPLTAITWDPDRQVLWVAGTTRGISAIDLDGNEVAETDRHDLRIYGLAYWEDDPDGYPLYVFNKERETNRQTVHKINPDNDEFEFVAYLEPEAGGNPVGAFITNQYDIYSWVFIDISSASRNAGGDRIDIWQVDARKDWMQIEPEAGVIEADAEQPFVLTLDATGLPPAPFEGEIVFTHDGVGGETHLPVTLNVVEGRIPTERTLQLGLGWNMVSVNLQPDERDVTVLTQPLVDEDLLEMMKDGFGHFYNPEFGFNNIPGWFVEQGYMMKVTDDCELTLEGMSVLAEDPIDLIEGWQIVSYYPRRPVEAILALSGIVDQLLIAKDGEGQFYIPEFGFSNMGDLREGQGYQLKMDEAARLVYTLQEEEVAGIPPQSGMADIPACPGRVCRHFGTVTSTGENMSLLVTMGSPLSPPLSRGVELGVFTPDGRLVGSGVFDDDGRCGVAIWGDDPTTPEIDGARSGEWLEIVLQDEDGRHSLSYSTLQGDGAYSNDGLWVITLNLEAAIPSEFGIVSAYPNPFNDRTNLRYCLTEDSEVDITIFNVTGQQILSLLNGYQSAGQHIFIIDGENLSSGVYVVQLRTNKNNSRQKITLLR